MWRAQYHLCWYQSKGEPAMGECCSKSDQQHWNDRRGGTWSNKNGRFQKSTDVGASDWLGTHSACHGGGIIQGFTHCYGAVKGHWSQEETFNSGKACKEEHVGHTCVIRCGLTSCEETPCLCWEWQLRRKHSPPGRGCWEKKYVGGWSQSPTGSTLLSPGSQSDEVDERDDDEEWDLYLGHR